RLLGLGWWLRTNGEAIYGTRPHERYDGVTSDGMVVRFTAGPAARYAVVLGTPLYRTVSIADAPDGDRVELLGYAGELPHERRSGALVVTLPDLPPAGHALCFRIGGPPTAG